MSKTIVDALDENCSHGAVRTAASRMLSAADIWSTAPALATAAVAPLRQPAPITPTAPPVSVISITAPLVLEQVRAKPWPPRRLSLALQGGGTFAAFSWGVLERLLEEKTIEIDTISGASAGAINALL